MNKIIYIGPIPPPLHGFSYINLKMLKIFESIYDRRNLTFINNTPRKSFLWKFGILNFYNFLQISFISLLQNRVTIYLCFSGGLRQWLDLLLIFIPSIIGVKIFIHHHSFSYLYNKNFRTTLILYLLRNNVHIVLCESMGNKLINSYTIPANNIRILSNAAHIDLLPINLSEKKSVSTIKLGYISAINSAKGVYRFINLVNEANALNMKVNGIIAGPLKESDKLFFLKSISLNSNIKYLGPVYNLEKTSFYNDIDLLVFPSIYPEAEPVTILESLQHGKPVITISKGCIPSLIDNDSGIVINNEFIFQDQSIKFIRKLLENPASLFLMQKKALRNFKDRCDKSHIDLKNLITEIFTS